MSETDKHGQGRAGRSFASGSTLGTVLLLLLVAAFWPRTAAAGEGAKGRVSLQAGVLELSGNTSFSVNYQDEGGRQSTHIRLTPSLGYFILDGLEVQLRASYVFENLSRSSAPDDRSEQFLFTLGPAYNFRGLSDRFFPFVGIHLGTYYQKFELGESSRSDLQLALGAEAGIRWLFTENLGLRFGMAYVHGFEADQIGATDFFGLEIGISLFIPTWPA